MINYILFLLVILVSNVIQGITGFAGTILAMPPSLMLVGYPIAKPVLNVLGLLSGIYVFAGNYKSVCWKELKKIVAVMAAGIIGGILIKGLFDGKEQILYKLLGVFILFLSVQGWLSLRQGANKNQEVKNAKPDSVQPVKPDSDQLVKPDSAQLVKPVPVQPVKPDSDQPVKPDPGQLVKPDSECKDSPALYLILALAGIVHGIFVSGGPLLISYLTKKIQDKVSFRATISTVWVFLNSMILVDDIRAGLWNADLLKVQLLSIPFLLLGMFIGGKLYVRMSQRLFMMITYILLFISGVSLLVK